MGNNFFDIKKKANKLLLDLDINSYPIDVFDIVDKIDNCILLTYTEYASRIGVDIYEASKQLNSDDATIVNKGSNCIILYNDTIEVKQRIRWSIAHEIGHIVLGHVNDPDCSLSRGLSEEKYDNYERESNSFASELLSNLSILHQIGISSFEDIVNICDISNQAAKGRYNKYEKWIKKEFKTSEDKTLCERFSRNKTNKNNIINITSHKKENILLGFCKCCGNKYELSNYQPNYCSVCGELFKFILEGDLAMIYEGHELDSRGKALICPICENEEKGNGPYCFVCGIYIVNKCSDENCGEIAQGNARYCEYCGEATTFYKNKILLDYKDIQANNQYPILDTTYDDLPF